MMATPNTNSLETNTRGGIFECVWRPVVRVLRFLCCCGPEIKPSVEETGQSSVHPW